MIETNKKIDLKNSLYDLTQQYPELIPILKDLGFMAITSPIIRNTLGRKMTIPNGCDKQRIELGKVVQELEQKGFQVLN